MHLKNITDSETKQKFINDSLLEMLLGLYTKIIFDQNLNKQPLDLDINKDVCTYDDIKSICDIDMASLNLKWQRNCFMNRNTNEFSESYFMENKNNNLYLMKKHLALI